MSLLKPGMSIVDHISRSLPAIASGFESDMEPLIQSTVAVRDLLKSRGLIIDIQDSDPAIVNSRSLATIDGGKVVQQMQTGDICISGAAIGEGARFKHLYESEQDTPSLADARILQHRSSNDELIRTIMGAQELALMSMIDHNIRIQDGSWLSSTTSLYLTLLGKDVSACIDLCRWLAGAMSSEMLQGDEIAQGVDRLIAPWRYADDVDIVALSKSDSSQNIAKNLLTEDDPTFYNLIAEHHGHKVVTADEKRVHLDQYRMMYSDRLLATQTLHPGEMFAPYPITVGQKFASRLNPSNKGIYGDSAINRALKSLKRSGEFDLRVLDALRFFLVDMLIERGYETTGKLREDNETPYECVNSLDDLSDPDDAWIWSTYMKPREFLPEQRSMRMEYSRVPGASALDQGQYLASMINTDVITSEMQEAFSQYIADKRAKEVSRAANMISSYIASTTNSSTIAMGLTRSYRT